MYRRLGDVVSRHPYTWIVFWLVFAVGVIIGFPKRPGLFQDGEFAFLPADAASQQARELYLTAFPRPDADDEDSGASPVQQDPLGSSIVIVLQREGRAAGLTDEDRNFISQTLVPRLEEIRLKTPRGYLDHPEEELPLPAEEIPESERVVRGITSFEDERVGTLLTSEDHQATMVMIDLKTEFLDRQNGLVLGRVEELLASREIKSQQPELLFMELSGSATVGRDMLRAEKDSASSTEAYTKILVIVLLLMIYRAPLLALVPLVTVGVAVEMSQALLRAMVEFGWIGMFTGLDVYVTVVVYGAGVDYCLFLIARYKEELDHGATHPLAVANSIYRVGAALATSAGTSIVGIAMMGFSDFGKFRQAGFAISFGLFVVLCFALTFTPAFLLVFGKWVFWPDVREEKVADKSGWIPAASLWSRMSEQRLLDRAWERVSELLVRRPGLVFAGTVLVMLPFAGLGVIKQNELSYALLTDLPQDDPSVLGAKAVQRHFSAGVTGPVTTFIRFDREALTKTLGNDLSNVTTAENLSEQINANLRPQNAQLGITDIRSIEHPLGESPEAIEFLNKQTTTIGARRQARVIKHKTYVSTLESPVQGQVLRMDFILEQDPFARTSIERLTQLEEALRGALPEPLRAGAGIFSLGTTAGIRDIKRVTDRDRTVIFTLVTISVYILIVVMLRKPRLCLYLIASVVFSYAVTLGVTYLVYWFRDPAEFSGLDWKIPVYLFTILIAMGEDYNILLMSRVEEEQERHGYVPGIMIALQKTGGIISSCGIIMAGTFFSLMSGTLLGMVQMGFALGFGVLLDTFVVRPILVPAYLVLLYSGRLGGLGRLLGAPADAGRESGPQPAAVEESQ